MVSLKKDTEVTEQYLPGMYIRVPLETQRPDNNFREFVLGQIQSVNTISCCAQIRLYGLTEDEPDDLEILLDSIDRCFILPHSSFTIAQTGEQGRILYARKAFWTPGKFIEYYVQIEGKPGVTCINESVLQVAANRQDYPPVGQLLRYEFQNPVWKSPRNHVIESCSELQNAAFGIEELIGTRLMLLPHQAEVVTRVLADTTCRYILADEVGLGKTIEASVILKGLRRRNSRLQTLIIAPTVLMYQWHQELNTKFWLDFPIIQSAQQLPSSLPQGGCIIGAEDLSIDDSLWACIAQHQWDLMIVDEAHHLYKTQKLYKHVHQLSRMIERVLILSATPIQRYAHEYLSLLAIMDPYRYDPDDIASFETLLQAQNKIRRATTLLAHSLKKDRFDAEDFLDDIEPILKVLKHDRQFVALVDSVKAASHSSDQSLSAAKDALAYVSENYRIERRIVRNRRVYLGELLPMRTLDVAYSYEPSEEEAETLDLLYQYIDEYLTEYSQYVACIEYCHLLMSAAFSSPHALLDVIETRVAYVTTLERSAAPTLRNVLLPVPPRQEGQRRQLLIELVPVLPEEYTQFLVPILESVQYWWEKTNQFLEQATQRLEPSSHTAYRLLQVYNALHAAMTSNPNSKVIVFSGWQQTLEALQPVLLKRYGKNAVTEFTCAYPDTQLQENADAFQSDPRCRILLCDELGGEGRNFQIANQIIHVDLPWTPTVIEQRIGRVDRIGRSGTVCSIVPYACGEPEEDLFKIWQKAFHLFTESMSGMEIALESIQNELLAALKHGAWRGLSKILDEMVTRATRLRSEVEEERYFEELAVSEQLRKDFEQLTEKFCDGKLLRASCLRWADLVGMRSEYYPKSDTVIFNPKRFQISSLKKAHFLQPPNMEEALRRSGRKNNLILRGTFNREIAVQHEELIFFAPGNDPWLDAIIANAIEAYQGRSCAILRPVPDLKETWRGFELLYSLTIDPRPLYELGYDPAHLFRAFGFLRTPTLRLLISEQGRRASNTNAVWQYIRQPFCKEKGDIHLGKRDGARSQIGVFKEQYPEDVWQAIVRRILDAAEICLAEELDDYMEEIATEAQDVFDRQAAGLKAAYMWQKQYTSQPSPAIERELQDYEHISAALIEGLRHPIRRLESVCYWILQGNDGRI